jgi:hypothetical protein
MNNYRGIFTYNKILYYDSYNEEDDTYNSEVIYVDCCMLRDVPTSNLVADAKYSKIVINYRLHANNDLMSSIINEYTLDLTTEESPPDVFHSFFSYKKEPYNGNLTNFEFNNCKMLVDIGDIKEGMEFKNIIVSVEIIPLPEFISEKMENKNIENEMEPSIIYYV